MATCRICNNSQNNQEYRAREMMFGTRDEFIYFECGNCGCVQIKEIPKNLGDYYPKNYYSYETKQLTTQPSVAKARHFNFFSKLPFHHRSVLGKNLKLREFYSWFRKAQVQTTDRILDFGSGNGSLLLQLYEYKFQNLTGIDPFLAKDIVYNQNVSVFKKDIADLTGEYDFLMAHHSYEHSPNPLTTLQHIARVLKPGGRALIRIPVVGYAWQKYKTDWVQLDAPRHLYLHTEKSMRTLGEQAHLKLEDIVYDSNEFQFWGSEQYQKGIPLTDKRSYSVNPQESPFSRAQIRAFRKQANALNRAHAGDSAAFYFYKDRS